MRKGVGLGQHELLSKVQGQFKALKREKSIRILYHSFTTNQVFYPSHQWLRSMRQGSGAMGHFRVLLSTFQARPLFSWQDMMTTISRRIIEPTTQHSSVLTVKPDFVELQGNHASVHLIALCCPILSIGLVQWNAENNKRHLLRALLWSPPRRCPSCFMCTIQCV